MRLFTLLVCLSVVLLAGTCKPDTHKMAEFKELEGTWLHAHEEDQGDVRVYRPNTYSFPPSRGRTGFSFTHNGLFTQYDIAPTDGLEGRKGTWTAEGDRIIRISLDDKRDPDYKLEILSLENNVLKVRRIE
ncbi:MULTISPECIES: lipocalin family protein [Hymenobacter]|uniref:Lipocalin-like domain-containing protein n=1 Tax=Hymenobacter jejuensis TaxID=2502781 RepID=A0A5B8A2R6_9BACT|nr:MULTISPECIES: lipocalin family protein [Hymenobacter]MBC6990644.1 lipocalin family protein [Hymenobacter sp. BT491]QDA60945.1 hypothetical protein FHG12_12895 [Hymenobacter jejuensis]